MEVFIVQSRIGPYEMFISQEAGSIGEAIVSATYYLMDIYPGHTVDIYAVQKAEMKEIVLEDLILN